MAGNVEVHELIIRGKTEGVKEAIKEVEELDKKVGKTASRSRKERKGRGRNSAIDKIVDNEIGKFKSQFTESVNAAAIYPVNRRKRSGVNIVDKTTPKIPVGATNIADAVGGGGGGTATPKSTPLASYSRMKASDASKQWKKVMDVPNNLRNSIGSLSTTVSQAIGEMTMFAGAITMVGFMATNAFTKMMQLGDAFASIEKSYFTTAAFRASLVRTGGMRAGVGFDTANDLNQKYGGYDQFTSGAMLSRAATQIREFGGNVNQSSLSNLATAAHGAAALTGDTADKTMSKVIEIAKKGKGTDKLGLAELKLTKNMDENIAIIANAIQKDPIASSILKRGTVESAMNRIRSAPKQLGGEVLARHSGQVSRIFNTIGDSMMAAAKDATEGGVIEAWSRTLTKMEEVTKVIFTDENMKRAAIGAAVWADELVVIGANMIQGLRWFLDNSEMILKAIGKFAKFWGMIQVFKFAIGVGNVGRTLFESLVTLDKFIASGTAKLGEGIGAATTKVASTLAIAAAVAWDAYQGMSKAESWGVEKGVGAISGAIFGTGEGGIASAFAGAIKAGLVGFTLAGPLGALAGGIFGAITGWFGGEHWAKWIQGIKDTIVGMFSSKSSENNKKIIEDYKKKNPAMFDEKEHALTKAGHELNTSKGVVNVADISNSGKDKVALSKSLDGSVDKGMYSDKRLNELATPKTLNETPSWNNPNGKVLILHGDLKIDSSVHIVEDYMRGMAGAAN